MKNGKRQKGQGKQGMNYEDAMNQAFSEIFQNLKVIKEGTKKQREKTDIQRRRGSAPPTALRETTTAFEQTKTEVVRKLSTPIPASNLSTTKRVLQCFEEEENM